MSLELRSRLYEALSEPFIIDPHTHINPLAPASKSLADILGYHYFTELAHSAGLAKSQIEADDLAPQEKVERIFRYLGPLNNTIQYSWFVEIVNSLLGFEVEVLLPEHAEPLWNKAVELMADENWEDQVLQRSHLTAVFLTNDFDDRLEGFNTERYIPCLRTDDLVFKLAHPSVRERLASCSGHDVTDSASLEQALRDRFQVFKNRGARACAISLPPHFAPRPVSTARADRALGQLATKGRDADASDQEAAGYAVFWKLAELCQEYRLPFDLMIGVNRSVYAAGVYQGQDLYDSRVSLIQYQQLFNAFPEVRFPISVLASVTNQELASYAWIFPNVIANGHWWYSNTPTYIEHDLAARLEAIPRTKQIGYYSDMYKLEFALPKFNMYKRILAKVLAERYVQDRGWSEERAADLGLQVLQRNTSIIFPVN
ncbi:MAG: glucuronate isomerase [Planctomycetales bacterium]|nr:glucuronate isomerase [Planctomycetales bacterium]